MCVCVCVCVRVCVLVCVGAWQHRSRLLINTNTGVSVTNAALDQVSQFADGTSVFAKKQRATESGKMRSEVPECRARMWWYVSIMQAYLLRL